MADKNTDPTARLRGILADKDQKANWVSLATSRDTANIQLAAQLIGATEEVWGEIMPCNINAKLGLDDHLYYYKLAEFWGAYDKKYKDFDSDASCEFAYLFFPLGQNVYGNNVYARLGFRVDGTDYEGETLYICHNLSIIEDFSAL